MGVVEIGWDNSEAIKEIFLGRRVTEVDLVGDTLTLDNGVMIQICPNDGCGGCSNGYYSLTSLNTFDNVIMNVEVVANPAWDGDTGSYRIFVYSGPSVAMLASVDGSDGNGYYGTGFSLLVTPYP